jgi:uroporphyrin-III C-methyltransferase / precorrin-2 dehydrogenase / sirohydrochlorin ferrochelatase
MHSLPLFHRLTGQKVILLAEGEAGEAKRRLLLRAGAVIVGPDDPTARLAFIALEAPEEPARELRGRGLLLNVTDKPDLCDFTVPSLLERGPVLVAVGTGGVSAGLAKALRLRLEGLLPAALGPLAEALGAARAALRARWPDGGERRRALDAALTQGGLLDPLGQGGRAAVAAWLEQSGTAAPLTCEFTVHSDDPDDLTLRQARWLGQADVVAYEPGVALEILNRARADAARVEVVKGVPAPSASGSVITIRRGSAG